MMMQDEELLCAANRRAMRSSSRKGTVGVEELYEMEITLVGCRKSSNSRSSMRRAVGGGAGPAVGICMSRSSVRDRGAGSRSHCR